MSRRSGEAGGGAVSWSRSRGSEGSTEPLEGGQGSLSAVLLGGTLGSSPSEAGEAHVKISETED